jgi:hypothetical protein
VSIPKDDDDDDVPWWRSSKKAWRFVAIVMRPLRTIYVIIYNECRGQYTTCSPIGTAIPAAWRTNQDPCSRLRRRKYELLLHNAECKLFESHICSMA